ncbi:hypothetical protein Lal_00006758 [Lupinus albus]|uniref:Putative transcription factor C2C2-Dof family n=1 Tax=Lupinus albus TaxID=3870 RepID=A0A6A4QAR9_LUPAL|nr:putative transcription factor C2C2-Dof family [Lupinus albus]KAF1876127.1 hypothetical protein Lal_00006758 [Lupinus albus]
MGQGHDSEGIKLFGTTITLHGKQRSEDKNENEDEKEKKKVDNNKIMVCPRCKSMETKFCYFNNYNVNQPRHFCKGCQRYWTAGGALRNVPIGAGRRKAKPPGGFLDGGFYDESTTVQKFSVHEGLVLEEWKVATVDHRDYRQLYPSKRQRISSGGTGQPC